LTVEHPDTLITELKDAAHTLTEEASKPSNVPTAVKVKGKTRFKKRAETKSDVKPAQVFKDAAAISQVPPIEEVQTGAATLGKYKGKVGVVHHIHHGGGRRRGFFHHSGGYYHHGYYHHHYDNDYDCFPATALVQTIEGQREITELKVGDLVLTHGGVFSKVLFFAVRKPTVQASFLTVKTANSTVTLTPSHAVFLDDGTPTLAGDIKVGQSLLSAGQIQSITKVAGRGLIAPVTGTGKLVVDGVTTSDYGPMATWMGQRLANSLLAPLHMLHWVLPEAQIWNAHTSDGVHPFKIWGSWLIQL